MGLPIRVKCTFMPHRSARAQKPRYPAPRLHLERKGRLHTLVLKPWLLSSCAAALLLLLTWATATTTYILFRDEVLTGLFHRHTQMQYAYEDRLASLRIRVDQLASRQLLDQEAYEAKLADVIARQSQLETRHSAVKGLVSEAQVRKRLSSNDQTTWMMSDIRSQTMGRLLSDVDLSLSKMETHQVIVLEDIDRESRRDIDRTRRALTELGLDTTAYMSAPSNQKSQGGPLLPANTARTDQDEKDAFSQLFTRTKQSLDEADKARSVIRMIPLQRPTLTDADITSGFGNRNDPFLGTLAMHAGIDFRGETGTPVVATATGIVSEASWQGGYGQMIEIDHGLGLSTRFGHLSSILVVPGQRIEAGQIIGRIGSTGRSTGPHLHYETRISGTAVDPIRFLRTGERLGLFVSKNF